LGFEIPENVGMNSKILTKIDSIANYAISKKMTPGIQVVVARKGKVIYQKSFGNHTYEATQKVNNTDVYDIASLTKIVATLPNIMQEFDQGHLTLETKLKSMLPEAKNNLRSNRLCYIVILIRYNNCFNFFKVF
uniref:serine hydrolase n=1 Tax=Flavobacterium sp. TaxID=239 RepID=UPI004047F897